MRIKKGNCYEICQSWGSDDFYFVSGNLWRIRVVLFQNRDPNEPEIVSDREILEIPCEYTQEQLLEGLTASDQEDGDLTSQIVAGSFSRFIEPDCAT